MRRTAKRDSGYSWLFRAFSALILPARPLLRQAADDAIGKLAGANGRYRLAKSILSAEAAMATIEVAPLYENVAALLNLVSEGSAIKPLLRLPVNGEGVEKQRLETFLHFLKEHPD